MTKKINWKKILQAGAIATDTLSKGSAGGLGKAIVDSEIDLSGNAIWRSETTDTAGVNDNGDDNYKDKPGFQNRVRGK
tara:strand:+ start:514 stop:747 length:234 start_codon:yes stop_codon:yes gene_type:complete